MLRIRTFAVAAATVVMFQANVAAAYDLVKMTIGQRGNWTRQSPISATRPAFSTNTACSSR
jgi:hypothetical protein